MNNLNDLIKKKYEKEKLLEKIDFNIKQENNKEIVYLNYKQNNIKTKYKIILCLIITLISILPIPFLIKNKSLLLLLLITSSSISFTSIIVCLINQIVNKRKYKKYNKINKKMNKDELKNLYKSHQELINEIITLDNTINNINNINNVDNNIKLNHVKRKVLTKNE